MLDAGGKGPSPWDALCGAVLATQMPNLIRTLRLPLTLTLTLALPLPLPLPLSRCSRRRCSSTSSTRSPSR